MYFNETFPEVLGCSWHPQQSMLWDHKSTVAFRPFTTKARDDFDSTLHPRGPSARARCATKAKAF